MHIQSIHVDFMCYTVAMCGQFPKIVTFKERFNCVLFILTINRPMNTNKALNKLNGKHAKYIVPFARILVQL